MTRQERKEKNEKMWIGVYRLAKKNNCQILMETAESKLRVETLATEASKLKGGITAIL